MTNKELELIGQLTEVAMIVAELKAENKMLKDINEKLNQALRKTDIVGRSEQLVNFLLYLNDKELINNYDFDYEKEAKKYLKKK